MARRESLTKQALLAALSGSTPTSAVELCQRLGISQQTLSRRLAQVKDDLVRIGKAQRTLYARRRNIGRVGSQWPLYKIDSLARPELLGTLYSLEAGQWWIDFKQAAPVLAAGDFSDGLYPDLPWFLIDARPQGFLGRQFAKKHALELNAPDDVERWQADDILLGYLRYGDELPGNIIVGEQALQQALSSQPQATNAMSEEQRSSRYGQLADAALQGSAAGSSAGGEQPKFTEVVVDKNGNYRHVIVKFSERISSPQAQRWSDLLICEHLAAEVLGKNKIPACHTEIIISDGRTCLESTRHDRIGIAGRRGQVSLGAFDDAYYGARDRWDLAAQRLHKDAWFDLEQSERLRLLYNFGLLIGNTDMHFGNISLTGLTGRPLQLTPSYDMLPMHYRPAANGEIVERELEIKMPLPENFEAFKIAAPMAIAFWHAVSKDIRISAEFCSEIKSNIDKINSTLSFVA
jgi:hypothetical protein